MHRDIGINPMQRIKDLLSEWAAWVIERQTGGYPAQSAFATERVQDGNRTTDSYYDNAPPDLVKVDQEIERLAPLFKQVLRLEYFDKRPTKTKAAVLGIPRQVFAQRISWIHVQLNHVIFGGGDE